MKNHLQDIADVRTVDVIGDADQRIDAFTGEVWGDVVLVDEGITVNSVFLAPGARTRWHRHDVAQVLHITHGRGLLWSADEGRGVVLEPGDDDYQEALDALV